MSQKGFTAGLIAQIQDINGNPSYSAQEKMEAIKNLKGAPKEDMYEYLNANFRTGPTLAKALQPYISKNRPVGAPKDSLKGTKKDSKK